MIRVVIARLADRGRFAIALLFLLVSTQLLWAADPMPESPPPSRGDRRLIGLWRGPAYSGVEKEPAFIRAIRQPDLA